jgi:hypothetical protein
MNILAIGNSFSEDATRYLHDIARADGEELQVTNLYIGGCSLESHYNNMVSDEQVYDLQINGHSTGLYVSIREALTSREWDVITLQQVSHKSFDIESYLPYVQDLADYVRGYCPYAKLYLHQTWAYEDGSARLTDIAKYNRADKMLEDIVKANLEIAKIIKADAIIRSGEMLGALLQGGISEVHRDTFHASLGLGRYALGLLWYRTITQKKVFGNRFCDFDEPISEEDILTVKKTVDSF